ncbi:MAG TPA: glycosyltransferase family A protein [Thermoanaerobaculia bacterium]|nr:glycosyltransferase family A protein [Thermoanaerobaculia bacterium]
MSSPRISAIVPVYNGRRFLRSALDSVFGQSLPPCELILVDDGSTDGSLDEVASLAPSGLPVRVLRQANCGQSSARNVAARCAGGEYLAFLDQDDLWHPDHLAALIEPLLADPAAGWAYSDFDEIDVDGNLVTRAFLRAFEVHHPKRTITDCVRADLMVLPSASVLRRTAFEAVGGFDEALSGYEDDDLFVRFFRSGWEQVFLDRTLVRFRVHDSGSSAARRFLDSRIRFTAKLAALLPDDPRMMRFYLRDSIAPRFFQVSLDDYVRACSAGAWEDARLALSLVNRFAALRRPSAGLRWKLAWIQSPRCFRWLVGINDRLPRRFRFADNPSVTLRSAVPRL